MQTANATRNVYQRLRDARARLTNIAKHGEAPREMGGYSYVRWDDVADQIGGALASEGLVVVPKLGEPQVAEVGKTQAGKAVFNTKVHLLLDVVNVDAPEDRVSAEWWGEAQDSGDKGIQKAATSATKFALMKLLQLAGAEDTEADITPAVERPNLPGTSVPTSIPAVMAGLATQLGSAIATTTPSSESEGFCVQCGAAGWLSQQGKVPRYFEGRFGPQCNGRKPDGGYANHKPIPAPKPAGPSGADGEYAEGDLCPSVHDESRYPAQFVIAKGGRFKGLLQCNGKLHGEYANHLAPVPGGGEFDDAPIPF